MAPKQDAGAAGVVDDLWKTIVSALHVSPTAVGCASHGERGPIARKRSPSPRSAPNQQAIARAALSLISVKAGSSRFRYQQPNLEIGDACIHIHGGRCRSLIERSGPRVRRESHAEIRHRAAVPLRRRIEGGAGKMRRGRSGGTRPTATSLGAIQRSRQGYLRRDNQLGRVPELCRIDHMSGDGERRKKMILASGKRGPDVRLDFNDNKMPVRMPGYRWRVSPDTMRWYRNISKDSRDRSSSHRERGNASEEHFGCQNYDRTIRGTGKICPLSKELPRRDVALFRDLDPRLRRLVMSKAIEVLEATGGDVKRLRRN
jgi:hypothetical protein